MSYYVIAFKDSLCPSPCFSTLCVALHAGTKQIYLHSSSSLHAGSSTCIQGLPVCPSPCFRAHSVAPAIAQHTGTNQAPSFVFLPPHRQQHRHSRTPCPPLALHQSTLRCSTRWQKGWQLCPKECPHSTLRRWVLIGYGVHIIAQKSVCGTGGGTALQYR